MVNDVGELRKIARAYSEEQVFTFIEETINDKKNFYNGYIIDVKTDMIIFLDKKTNQKFPILLETISHITPSKIKRENGNP